MRRRRRPDHRVYLVPHESAVPEERYRPILVTFGIVLFCAACFYGLYKFFAYALRMLG